MPPIVLSYDPPRILVPWVHPELNDSPGLVFTGSPSDGQVFTHVDLEGHMRSWHIPRLIQLIATKPEKYEPLHVSVNAEQAAYLVSNNGIELDHLDRLMPAQLNMPGILIHFPDEGTDIFVDGNHRYVRLMRDGITEMKCWRVTERQAMPALIDLPSEMSPLAPGFVNRR